MGERREPAEKVCCLPRLSSYPMVSSEIQSPPTKLSNQTCLVINMVTFVMHPLYLLSDTGWVPWETDSKTKFDVLCQGILLGSMPIEGKKEAV